MKLRVEIARSDSDTALFYDLMHYGEMILKFAVAGIIAAIHDDRDRTRYGFMYRLLRASGIGDWASSIDEILIGPAAQHLSNAARIEQRELTIKCNSGEWQYDSILALYKCIETLDRAIDPLSNKVDGRKWFSYFANLRNKTKGHGALSGESISRICPYLERSLNIFVMNFSLFNNRQWAYVYRNLSGKYRISVLRKNLTK